ncbi:unnamed protein product [Protopolystoma xenopodis]|uniref:Uncharacterized protein n=1 Tax=Protopolystoma xenopodis TaxID=117903 RepID=A0A3S4ZJL1_9PLAT|nr:unnamed protein product [Protopolystoma xenopodis]
MISRLFLLSTLPPLAKLNSPLHASTAPATPRFGPGHVIVVPHELSRAVSQSSVETDNVPNDDLVQKRDGVYVAPFLRLPESNDVSQISSSIQGAR